MLKLRISDENRGWNKIWIIIFGHFLGHTWKTSFTLVWDTFFKGIFEECLWNLFIEGITWATSWGLHCLAYSFHYKIILGFVLWIRVSSTWIWMNFITFYLFQIFSFSLVRAPFFSHLLKGPLILVFSQGYSYLSIFILGEVFWLSHEAIFFLKN